MKEMFAKNSLYFMLMNDSYYKEMGNLDEFQEDSNRGHGVMIVDINDHLIAVPLRSKLKPHFIKAPHIFAYKTYLSEGNTYLKGLDFSKTTIIEKKHVNTKVQYIFNDEEEKIFYLNNFSRLQLRITNYIKGYITLCSKINNNEDVSSQIKKYRFTTLKNFHKELNIEISKEDFNEILRQIFP
ncbi:MULTISPECIES: hypothetical protein [Mammaliicoccus]|nr:hypothetical protein [Mammaliicoccus sciuri]MCO4324324.1 hypothetical protein [Mammaliicoccus sciuri]MEB6232766.1 hypothetical protein [Mammaliicoccus sciuri]MEB7819657.1 hypothetical protein [Mammaliicoccus sciuri]